MNITEITSIAVEPGLQLTEGNYRFSLLAPRHWAPSRNGYVLAGVRKEWEANWVNMETGRKSKTITAATGEEVLETLLELEYDESNGSEIYKTIINSEIFENISSE